VQKLKCKKLWIKLIIKKIQETKIIKKYKLKYELKYELKNIKNIYEKQR